MRKLLALLASAVLALALAAPASAAAPDTCNIEGHYCNVLDQWPYQLQWVYGTAHNLPLVGNANASDPYAAFVLDGSGYWYIQTSGGLYWTMAFDPNTGHAAIYLEGYQANDSHQHWTWTSSGTGGHIITNQYDGPHWGVWCCVAGANGYLGYIGFENGATGGGEYWNWKS